MGKIKVEIDKNIFLMKVIDLEKNIVVFEEVEFVLFDKGKVIVILKENFNEYFYGGGVQNGCFLYKGKVINIVNENSWIDGGVVFFVLFYWLINGYGMMWYIFKLGKYDFGVDEKGKVKFIYDFLYFDFFYMVSDGVVGVLNDFYQLIGNLVLLFKFGFYQGYLNVYNCDYWKEDEKGILFEDGKCYKESQKDNGGIKELLNGEKNNYQFLVCVVIDCYKNYDMLLGWFLLNDGYGVGYGQMEIFDGNIQNLKSLGDYVCKNGVEIGLWI